MQQTSRRKMALGIMTATAVLVGAGFLVARSGDSEDTPDVPPARTNICDELDDALLKTAMGGDFRLREDDTSDCVITLDGSSLQVALDEVTRTATIENLDAVERTSGPNPDSLTPWPMHEINDLGDAAKWFSDPDAGTEYGELYVLNSGRLIRITVATPADYRRTAQAIGTQIGPVILKDLAPTN